MSGFSVDALERSAAAGDVAAVTQLGVVLLSGEGGQLDAPRGVELLTAAAQHGDARACALAAVIAGAGACRPQNWNEALDWLARAAESGWVPARKQLTLLAGTEPDSAPDWARLRAGVDVAAWTAPPPKQSLVEDPRIRCFDDFATQATCAWLIERAHGRLSRAHVYDAATGGAAVHHARTNSETDFNIVECDIVLLLLRARIAAATGLPPAVMELTKVLHYAPGQQFDPHFDFIDPGVPGYAAELAARGQRIATFLLYLNDEYEGGETEFPELDLKYKGRRGAALLFANVDRSGAPDRRTLHAGLPPANGEKWLLSQWIRDRTPTNS